MAITNRVSAEVKEAPLAGPQPSDSELSVVFRGDGEPNTPRRWVSALTEFDSEAGLESDAYTLGGTVERLERRFADMLGKEAAVFVPTGTLANHLAIRKHCGVRPRAIVQEQSHLYNDTGDCVTRLSGINLIPLAKGQTCFTLDELEEAMVRSETGRVVNPVGAVMVESPVRRRAGQIVPYDQMTDIAGFCQERGIPVHLDGARLYMMSAATGVEPRQYAALFDTVYVSLYKYFGAPFGAILAGTSEFIGGLYHDRRMFGGGLASSCLAAALALKGTEGFEERFAAAMNKATALFPRLNRLDGMTVRPFEHGSNIFPVELDSGVDVGRFIARLHDSWVFVHPSEAGASSIFLTVNTTILRQSNDELVGAFADALEHCR